MRTSLSYGTRKGDERKEREALRGGAMGQTQQETQRRMGGWSGRAGGGGHGNRATAEENQPKYTLFEKRLKET